MERLRVPPPPVSMEDRIIRTSSSRSASPRTIRLPSAQSDGKAERADNPAGKRTPQIQSLDYQIP